MSEKKDNAANFITPGGAGLAAICFFLPWIRGCDKTMSGADMGGAFWLVFLAAIAILAAFFIFRSNNEEEKTKPVAIICSLLGIGVLLWKYVEVKNQFRELSAFIQIEIGAYGTVIGLAAALFGAAFLEESGPSNIPMSSQADQSTGQSYTDPPQIVSKSVCPNCNKVYDGDIEGQYCEECGTMLT